MGLHRCSRRIPASFWSRRAAWLGLAVVCSVGLLSWRLLSPSSGTARYLRAGTAEGTARLWGDDTCANVSDGIGPDKLRNKTSMPDGKFRTPVTHVLLVTYMRGGSSLLGELFNQDPSVFYYFEPLASVWDILHIEDSRNWFLYDNFTLRQYPSDNKSLFFKLLTDAFHCESGSLPLNYLKDRFVLNGSWRKSNRQDSYRDCIRDKKAKQGLDFPELASACKDVMAAECRKCPTRVIKTVRMRMDLVRTLMIRFPNMFVVHLVRDPRGILNSRWVSSMDHRQANFELDTDLLCKQMVHDLNVRLDMEAKYQQQIYQMKYETLVTSPYLVARTLYRDILGTNMSNHVKRWITQNTQAVSDNGVLGTARQNASVHADEWRTSLSSEMQNIILERCRKVLIRFGYTP